MFKNLPAFVTSATELDVSATDPLTLHERRLCLVLCLKDCASQDGEIESPELNRIVEIVGATYGLLPHEVGELLEVAALLVKNPLKVQTILSRLRESLSPDERVEILASLWRIALSDNELTWDESRHAASARVTLGLSVEQALHARAQAEARHSSSAQISKPE